MPLYAKHRFGSKNLTAGEYLPVEAQILFDQAQNLRTGGMKVFRIKCYSDAFSPKHFHHYVEHVYTMVKKYSTLCEGLFDKANSQYTVIQTLMPTCNNGTYCVFKAKAMVVSTDYYTF